ERGELEGRSPLEPEEVPSNLKEPPQALEYAPSRVERAEQAHLPAVSLARVREPRGVGRRLREPAGEDVAYLGHVAKGVVAVHATEAALLHATEGSLRDRVVQ